MCLDGGSVRGEFSDSDCCYCECGDVGCLMMSVVSRRSSESE